MGHENLYPTQVLAIAGIYARAHMGSSEKDCPLTGLAHRLTELSLHESGILRGARRHGLKLCRHIAVLRFDGPLPLSNRRASQSEFIRWAKRRPEIRNIVFVAYALDRIDKVEAGNLAALVEAVREAGYRVVLTGFSDHALDALSRSGAAESIGLEHFYPSEALAIASIFTDAHADDEDEDCPFKEFLPKLVEISKHHDGSYRDAARNQLALCKKIVALRFDGTLNYTTYRYFEKKLRGILAARPSAKHILLAVNTLNGLDLTAAGNLLLFFSRLKEEGYWVGVSGLRDDDREILQKENRDGVLAGDALFPSESIAIERIHAEAHRASDETACPLISVVNAPESE
jgi:MFS superfamily sulfate permease-like transporter